ncbi:ribosomal-protein-alanine N-acetyltransferase [Mesorhizobium sp. M1A.F.Ca.IN.022.07.1.1]|uniref:ribosomal protein S18-alanine N-acetyltransferase n=1 Tax=unclassified Mesorhizobium TaxID=325217 RepID=UPI000BAEF1F6|nr:MULTISPECIES: ribosomal protein S18-alanine N-acetyltransferase [unclassified Mesorhizobium]TGV95043.1 ribosomal-protein-alanine N-acetyltransferase [Mesorhizobium sp. M00.F.Ca.ET.158.01.1.1]AZO59869.1 ribosomal-protein-alanine N-acetyltransferase [Mesorhizobium sp. M1A.F.Ca.IN.022.06.1.1]MCT2580170.1 ribosomal protein S18-alanine N-acetyltransferase [Mesorhizobium sp. P13.3]MDF3169112.1 ribosomal protein S18-alanine N-acetyltransferase [Mesorhizobium sp. P16.1]MDF3177270.1 ribosomal protei
MRIPFFQPRRRDYALEPLTVADSAAVAVLHREDFVRPWTDGEFAALLEQDTVFGYAARETGQGAKPPVGFVLARLAAGEGEILTVAVARAHRRQGLGWQLIDAVLRELHAQRAEALFLEVDETNTPAIALYRRLGFRQVGQRPNYYRSTEHGPTGALVMRRDLR